MDQSSLLIIGGRGQLSIALQLQYPKARVAGSEQLDISDQSAVKAYDYSGVKVILNAAAYTDVDGAETTEGRLAAWRINAEGARNLTAVALARDLTLVHISSDYVFDGTQRLHNETEPLSPLGVYGQTKAAADIVVSLLPRYYILRTSWVIGDGKNFVRSIFGLAQKGIAPSVIADQIGRLTFTSELARVIDHLLLSKSPYGTYNASNSGPVGSWADIARDVFKAAHVDLPVNNTTIAAYYEGKANISLRPINCTFDLTKLQTSGFVSHDWREDLKNYVIQELIA